MVGRLFGMCFKSRGAISNLPQIDIDHSLEAHLEAINDSLGSLSLSCSHHGTGHSPPIASQPQQSGSSSSSEGRGRTPLQNDNRHPENTFIERFGVGAQFDKCENPEWAGSIDLDFLAHTDHSEEGLLDAAVDRVPMTPYPQFRAYDVEEWIEHLPVPLRYASISTLHQPSFQDPAMEFSSTTEGNTQCASGSGKFKCFEVLGTQPAVFQQSDQNLDTLLSPVASSQVSSSELLTVEEFSRIQKSEQLSTGPDRKRRASNTSQWEGSKRSRSVGGMCSDVTSSNASSAVSDMSGCSHASWSGRKGRRRQPTVIQTSHKSTSSQQFQCTWCLVAFTKKSDWRRHEESQHAPQTEWVCMPEGAHITESGETYCLFCMESNPGQFHLTHRHAISSCLERPSKNRRFDRKDHLIQHISRWHDVTPAKSSSLAGIISNWQRPIHAPGTEQLWDCGFCEVRGMTWDQRYVHVAGHMKAGLNMRSSQQPGVHFCTRSGCIQRFTSHMSWRTHEETGHEHDLDLWACKKPSTLNSTVTCGRIFTSQDAMSQHLYADHKTLDTVHIKQIPCPGSDCPYDLLYNIFWCGFCRTFMVMDQIPHSEMDRFAYIEKYHFRPQRGIDSWHAIEVQERIWLVDAVSAAIQRWEDPLSRKFCRYRLSTLRKWLRTRQ